MLFGKYVKSFAKYIINELLELKTAFLIYKKTVVIKRTLGSYNKIDNEIYNQHKRIWAPIYHKFKKINLDIYCYISGIISSYYIPEIVYYNIVEPTLNNRNFSHAYSDKNIYDLLFEEKNLFPQTVLRRINGVYYDEEYKNISLTPLYFQNIIKKFNKIILKPSTGTGGGRNVVMFELNNNVIRSKENILNIEYLENIRYQNFILQEYIEQSDYFAQFNKSSLNTIRMFTYRSCYSEKIDVLSSVLRIGREGSIVDNQAAGGISIGIKKDGTLNNFAINKYGSKFTSFNGYDFTNYNRIPQYDAMKRIAIYIAERMLYTRLLGIDISYDKNEKIRIIEINVKNIEINFLQMNNGPLFQSEVNEIIQYCRRNYKTINVGMYV